MASTAFSTPDSREALRARFLRLAAALPSFLPRQCPDDAADYLDYYGLDVSPQFHGVSLGIGAVASGDHRLALHCWEQPAARGTLLLVHGYFDHVGLYGHLLRFGLSRGLNVVAFDLPGHGISSGPRAEIRDFSEYRQAMADVLAAVSYLPGPRHVIAQSTGGAATMDFLQQAAEPALDKVILLAPLVRPVQWRRIVFLQRLLNRFVDRVPRRFADSSQDQEFLSFLRRDPLQSLEVPVCWVAALCHWQRRFLSAAVCHHPMLIIQGDADNTVDWRFNLKQICRLFSAAKVHMVAGGRHHLANECAQVRRNYQAVVAEYLENGHSHAATAGGHAKDAPDSG
jgi:lysophospholipase